MNLSILLHLYQPATQDLAITKEIAETCYIPLIKLIKQKKKLNITLNLPLSLLAQMDTLGYKSWLADIKELYESERLEIVGTAAYHPLLSKVVSLNKTLTEQQIILNEYSLGYYFGKDKGFEGESALLLRDLKGFFPPELALSNDLVSLISELGYEWVLADEVSVQATNSERRYGVFSYKDSQIKILARNRELSNLLSFKRDLNVEDFMATLHRMGDSVIALDAEYFGHHHKDGLYLLDVLVDALSKHGVNTMTCSNFVEASQIHNLDSITESTWATTEHHLSKNDIYPNWAISSNDVHAMQWELLTELLTVYEPDAVATSVEGLENFPVWKLNESSEKIDDKLFQSINLNLLVLKAMNSDQFWWASKNPFRADGMVTRSLQIFEEISHILSNPHFSQKYTELSQKIYSALEK